MFFFLTKVVRRRLRQSAVTLTTAIAGMLFLWVASTIGVAAIEGIGWKEAAWQVWQTVTTVGYGDGPPKSDGGRLITIVYSVLGIALFGKAISVYTEYREEQRNRRRFGLLTNNRSHAYVLIHYPGASRLSTFVSQIRMLEPEAPICIVDSTLEELARDLQLDRDIHFVRGSLLSRETYEKAGVQTARQVIVFPRPDQGSEADATSKTIVEIIEESFLGRDTRVVCVLADAANAWMFEKTVAQLIQGDLEILALVQECQDIHAGAAVQELLSNERGANPITVQPNMLVGKTWGDLCQGLLALERSGTASVRPFALVKNARPLHCPAWSTPIERADRLILISAENLDWPKVEQGILTD
jgi:voltage-gated potassium channel